MLIYLDKMLVFWPQPFTGNFFETWIYNKDVPKNFQPILFCQSIIALLAGGYNFAISTHVLSGLILTPFLSYELILRSCLYKFYNAILIVVEQRIYNCKNILYFFDNFEPLFLFIFFLRDVKYIFIIF